MNSYHVKREYVQHEVYCFDDIIEAKDEQDAIAKASEAFDFDPSPYAIGESWWTENPAIEVNKVS